MGSEREERRWIEGEGIGELEGGRGKARRREGEEEGGGREMERGKEGEGQNGRERGR